MQKERRQFSVDIVRCDGFVSMPATAQALYFQLVMSCDDEGFTSQVEMCKFLAHASDKDVDMLLSRNFIIQFKRDGEPTVTLIKHWRMNNWIRNGRETPSKFSERNLVYINANDNYTLDPKEGRPLAGKNPDTCQPDVNQLADTCQTLDRHLADTCQSVGNRKSVGCLPTMGKEEKREKEPKRVIKVEKQLQSNLTQSNLKIKPDITRYNQFSLLELLEKTGFISWDEAQDGWDEVLDKWVKEHGYVNTKVKLKYFIAQSCKPIQLVQSNSGKTSFEWTWVDDGSVSNRFAYFTKAMENSFKKQEEAKENDSPKASEPETEEDIAVSDDDYKRFLKGMKEGEGDGK